jgi:hypothetical protein
MDAAEFARSRHRSHASSAARSPRSMHSNSFSCLALKKPVPPSVVAYHDHLAHIEAGNALDPASFEELAPAADRGVVEERGMGGLPALPLVQKHQGRAAGYAASRKPVARAP